MPNYYIFTIGCQMNQAEAERLESLLNQKGYLPVESADYADLVLLVSCAVRQSAEERITKAGMPALVGGRDYAVAERDGELEVLASDSPDRLHGRGGFAGDEAALPDGRPFLQRRRPARFPRRAAARYLAVEPGRYDKRPHHPGLR